MDGATERIKKAGRRSSVYGQFREFFWGDIFSSHSTTASGYTSIDVYERLLLTSPTIIATADRVGSSKVGSDVCGKITAILKLHSC